MRAYSQKLILCISLVIVTLAVPFAGCKDNGGPEGGWKFIGDIMDEKDSRVSVYIDVNNIETDGETRNFWVKYMAYDSSVDPPAEYIRQEGYWEVDCYDRELTRLAEEYYAPDGTLLGRTQEPLHEEYSSKNTIGAKMAAAACRYAGK